MKKIIWFFAISVLAYAIYFGNGGTNFTGNLGLTQYLFIGITIITFLFLLFFLLYGKREFALVIFLVFYPFLAQSTYYLNFSTSYFIISPSLLLILIMYLLVKSEKASLELIVLFLFCLSTILGVLNSENLSLSITFFILAVGVFIIMTLLGYNIMANVDHPVKTVRFVISSVFVGMAIFLLIETIKYSFTPSDVLNILMRKWSLLSSRYYTAGYKEPNGFGFVAAFLTPFLIFFYEVERKMKKGSSVIALIFVFFGLFLILLSGSRGAIITFVNIFIILFLLGKRIQPDKNYRINIKKYVLVLSPFFIAIIVLLLYRTFINTSDTGQSYKQEVVEIGGQDIEAIGTTIGYINHTINSWDNLMNLPQGTGPLNHPLSTEDYQGSYSSYSLISNLIVIGSIFGWFSLFCWLFFLLVLLLRSFRIYRHTNNKKVTGFVLVGIGAIFGSLLPASFFLGPLLNWSTFDFNQSITIDAGVPSEYPSVISGLIFGVTLGLMRNWKSDITE